MSCDNYKKNFIIGISLIILMVFIKPITLHIVDIVELIGIGLSLFLVFFLCFFGLYLMLPYLRCISESNKRNKPPR